MVKLYKIQKNGIWPNLSMEPYNFKISRNLLNFLHEISLIFNIKNFFPII